MNLPAFALFERALRLESRSALVGWSRVGLLTIILFLLLSVHTMAGFGWYGAPGLNFLERMVWANLVFISLAGLSYFASAITEEKEEMMLGLLRMTDLNGVAILLGKSTSRLIGAILLLLVQVPFVLLAVTLGGVGTLQIAAAYATLLAYLFFLCNLALLLSVVFRNTATAGGITLLLLFVFFFGPSWSAGIEQNLVASHPWNINKGIWPLVTAAIDHWREATPGNRLGVIFQSGFAGPAAGFQVASNIALGVLAFLVAWALFDRCTREEKDTAPARRWFAGRAGRRDSRIPRRIVGPRVITWKDFTFIAGGRLGLILKFCVVGLVLALFNIVAWEGNSRINVEFEGESLIWISILVTAIWLALEASRIFKEEVRWKTLSSLITLPISVPELIWRKVAGALAGTLPLLSCFVLGLVLVPDKVGSFFSNLFKYPESFGGLAVAVLQFILFLHLTAYLSLVVKRGALPLAIAIQYMGGSFCLGFLVAILRFGGFGGFAALISLACIVLTIVLQGAIGMRLGRLAAEE